MTISRYILGAGLVAAAFVMAVPSAHAVTFTFAEPPGLPSADVPTPPFTTCFTTDRCETTLRFVVDSLGVTVSSEGVPHAGRSDAVIQDLGPVNGGLGVVYKTTGGGFTVGEGEDEINEGQTLILTFDIPVILNTLTFFDDDHLGMGVTDGIDGSDTFGFGVDGVFNDRAFGDDFSGTQGTIFSFRLANVNEPEEYYIGGMSVQAVPEPGTLGLLGIGLVGLVGRVRKRLRG